MMPLLRNIISREERNRTPPGNTCIPYEKDSPLSFSWLDDEARVLFSQRRAPVGAYRGRREMASAA